MRRKTHGTVSWCIAAGLALSGLQVLPALADETPVQAESPADQGSDSVVGTLIFAQCEEYINIREQADTDSDVTAKIYNHDSATVLSEQDGWYEIQSGNAHGYVKAEYFATGEEADKIAEEVAYHVATVHPDELNIRTAESEDSDVLDIAKHNDELEVVAYDGDWMKVALGNDVYGYISAYYVDYTTYYPTAETLEEEQARLAAEAAAREETAVSDHVSTEEISYDNAETSTSEEISSAPSETEETEAPSYSDETEAPSYPDETEAPSYPDETEAPSYPDETEAPSYPDETEAPSYPDETEAPSYPDETEAPSYPDETEAPSYPDETEAPSYPDETEAPSYPDETETPSSDVGQQIADYAVQFVGNPYVWGGTSLTNGADCSGFVQSVFANFGIYLSRVAADQAGNGTYVDLGSLLPGDLLFYGSGSINHVAIYIGGGQIVHAANSSSGICISSAYYSTPVCAVRCW